MERQDIFFFVIMLVSIGASILRSVQKKNETKGPSVNTVEPEMMEEGDIVPPASETAVVRLPEEGMPVVHDTAASRAGQWRKTDHRPEPEPVVEEKRERHPVALDKEKLIIYSEIMKPKFDE